MSAPLRANARLAFVALLARSGTLVCCVLPALMITPGPGATLGAGQRRAAAHLAERA